MEISPILLLRLWGSSFIWGIIIGILNDISRISRAFFANSFSAAVNNCYDKKLPFVNFSLREKLRLKQKKHSVFFLLVFLQDFLLAIIFLLGLLFLNYGLNKGVFRFFCLPIAVLGGITYYFSVGKIVFRFSEFVCFAVRAFFVLFFYAISRTFVNILIKTKHFVKKIYIFLKNSIAKQIKKRYNICKDIWFVKKSQFAFFSNDSL